MDEDKPGGPVAIVVEAPAWHTAVKDPHHVCSSVAQATLSRAAPSPWRTRASLDVLLTDDNAIRRLNAEWRGQDTPTNVLAFQAREDWPEMPPAPSSWLGDIVVAYETTAAEASAAGKPVADHLAHLIAHGTLHLLGFDHGSDQAAEQMERLEQELLTALGFTAPYGEPGRPTSNGEERDTGHAMAPGHLREPIGADLDPTETAR